MTEEIIVFSFTRTGTGLNRRLCRMMRQRGTRCKGYAPEKFAENGIEPVPGNSVRSLAEAGDRAHFFLLALRGSLSSISPLL